MLLTGLISAVATTVSGLMPTFLLVVLFRFVLGFGVGLSCSIVPAFAAESVSSEPLKEQLLVLFQINITLGLFVANIVA